MNSTLFQNGEESENESFDKDVNNEEQKKYYFERNKIKYVSARRARNAM